MTIGTKSKQSSLADRQVNSIKNFNIFSTRRIREQAGGFFQHVNHRQKPSRIITSETCELVNNFKSTDNAKLKQKLWICFATSRPVPFWLKGQKIPGFIYMIKSSAGIYIKVSPANKVFCQLSGGISSTFSEQKMQQLSPSNYAHIPTRQTW